MVEDGAFSHKIDYVTIFWEILLNGWILPIGGASAMVCLGSTWLPLLVNRPGVAGAILQTPSELPNQMKNH